ncbi:hypothetical protein UFOVP87_7 [uncultured Caudovirales phage]|uniref:DUF6046 domain-containing protein n=1 Tax=uncultured Caudovirales phage TaxID=2100421 RepID=A0A6J5L0D3_9CAUD|nr:hypothetical protein UFOVP87_7 [uncultured Caudovirales phage]
MDSPNFKQQLFLKQSQQILHAYGLSALKTTFYNFNEPNVQDEPEGYSAMGTPIFDTITFYGNETNGDIKYYDLTLQKTVIVPKMTIDIALITVNKYINVTKTNVIGANYSVKQYINLGDYDIDIKGIFTSEIPDTVPSDKIKQLHRITNSTAEVNVASKFLALFDITCIVFEGQQTFEQAESQRDVQKFSLHAINETPFTIKVTQQGSLTSKSRPMF